MKKQIPNFLTLLNLFFGCTAVAAVLYGEYQIVLWCYLLSGLMDFGDGFAARLLGVSSPAGKELDSLSDMVSFGVVPGMILFVMLGGGEAFFAGDRSTNALLPFAGFIFTMFACLRLAKFNLDTRQSVDFIGLNTPTATGFVIGLLMILTHDTFGLADTVVQREVLLPVILLFSYLMISELPMFSGKFQGMQWSGNEWRIVFLILTIVQFLLLGYAAFATVVLTYILLSGAAYLLKK